MFASRFRRLPVLAVLAAVGLASVGAVGLASVGALTTAHARSISAKPTIVLVHGAFADSSGFDGVIDRLRHDGYPVVAAPNPLLGLAFDADTVRAYINSIPGPKILVGHSYGGAVITQATSGDPDVKALVYVAAFAPARGERLNQLLMRRVAHPIPPAAPPGKGQAARRHDANGHLPGPVAVPRPVRRRRPVGGRRRSRRDPAADQCRRLHGQAHRRAGLEDDPQLVSRGQAGQGHRAGSRALHGSSHSRAHERDQRLPRRLYQPPKAVASLIEQAARATS